MLSKEELAKFYVGDLLDEFYDINPECLPLQRYDLDLKIVVYSKPPEEKIGMYELENIINENNEDYVVLEKCNVMVINPTKEIRNEVKRIVIEELERKKAYVTRNIDKEIEEYERRIEGLRRLK